MPVAVNTVNETYDQSDNNKEYSIGNQLIKR